MISFVHSASMRGPHGLAWQRRAKARHIGLPSSLVRHTSWHWATLLTAGGRLEEEEKRLAIVSLEGLGCHSFSCIDRCRQLCSCSRLASPRLSRPRDRDRDREGVKTLQSVHSDDFFSHGPSRPSLALDFLSSVRFVYKYIFELSRAFRESLVSEAGSECGEFVNEKDSFPM